GWWGAHRGGDRTSTAGGVDHLDPGGAGGGPVAREELELIRLVEPGEEDLPVERGQVADERGAADLCGARRGPVADGEPAVGGEEELPVGGREVRDARVDPEAAREDRDLRGPVGGPVGPPDL